MATTAAYALAHVFLPNLVKLKGATTVISAVERKEKVFFDQVWNQAHVTHDPNLASVIRDPYRIAVIDLPAPKEMGEAHLVGIVIKKNDSYVRYFTLEHDYVLAKKANRTVLCERDGQKHIKHGDGSPITGNFTIDSAAFVDCFMELIAPTTVAKK